MPSRVALMILALVVIAAAPAQAQVSPAPAVVAPSPAPSPNMMNVLAPTFATPPLQTITFEGCNQMPYTISVSVAYPDGNTETAAGWQPIAAGTCATMGPFPLNRKRFSFYAFGDRGRKDWVGPTNFCVNTGAYKFENAYRATSGSLCPNQGPTRPFISVTPAMLLPNDPSKRDDPALKFKYNFN